MIASLSEHCLFFETSSKYFMHNMKSFQTLHAKKGQYFLIYVLCENRSDFSGWYKLLDVDVSNNRLIVTYNTFGGHGDSIIIDVSAEKDLAISCHPRWVSDSGNPVNEQFLRIRDHLFDKVSNRERPIDVTRREFGVSYLDQCNGRKKIHELHIDVVNNLVTLIVPTDPHFNPVVVDLEAYDSIVNTVEAFDLEV
jgi:hypothetical protein